MSTWSACYHEQGVPPRVLYRVSCRASVLCRPPFCGPPALCLALRRGRMWPRGPLTHATSWPPCVRWGYQGENSRLSSRPSPSPSGAVLCTGQISFRSDFHASSPVLPHRWASLAGIDGGFYVRERRPARKEQERKSCDRCAVGSLLFGTSTVVCFVHRERIVFLLDQA